MITEKQREERKLYIGSSDAAAILGLSRWATQLSCWAEKTGQIVPEDISDELRIKVGNKAEQMIAELFMEETGKTVHKVNETVYHPDYPFIACNLDRRIVGEKALLEIKTASAYKSEEWADNNIPAEYIVQVYHQMACTGWNKAYIACLIGGNQEFVIREIDRHEPTIIDMIRKEVYFWETFVLPKVMPVQISCFDSPTLYSLFPEATTPEIELNDEADQLIEQIEALGADYNNLYGQLEQKKNQLKAILKEAECGKSSRYTVTWKQQIKKAYTVKESKTRVLRIKENKEEKE